MVKVKPIKTQGQSTLVQWVDGNGRVRRAYIPTNAIEDEQAPQEELSMGIPYGEPWGDMFKDVDFNADDLEVQLNRRGIWERQDLLDNPSDVAGAISAVIGITLGKVLKTVKENQDG